MDYRKLDAGVAAAVDSGDPDQLSVFVHVSGSLAAEDGARLAERLGLSQPVRPGAVLTLTLPVREVGELSDESWVVAIRAARRLRPLE